MRDLMLQYRACGAAHRENRLRMLASENGLSIIAVHRMADQLAERGTYASYKTVRCWANKFGSAPSFALRLLT